MQGFVLGGICPTSQPLAGLRCDPPPAQALQGIDGLGAGETEGIALARSIEGSVVLLDDRRAREVAASLGVRVTGTLGVLLLAKERGLVARISDEIDRLQAFGFRLSDPVRRAVLEIAGEGG